MEKGFIELNGRKEELFYSPSVLFRKKFNLTALPEKVTMRVCGLGLGVYYINGQKITDDVFLTPVADYRKTLWYTEYDVTRLLKEGENTVCAEVGNGFYNENFKSGWHHDEAKWRSAPCLWLQLFCDEVILQTDESWRAKASEATFYNQLRSGEYYDSRKTENWTENNYDDSEWASASFAKKQPQGKLVKCECEPMREYERCAPVNITENDNGYLFDFGVNISGYAQLNICADEGTEITLAYAEEVDEKGDLKLNGCGCYYPDVPFQTDKFICSGQRTVWKPQFTYHGFRYVEVRGLTEKPDKNLLTAIFTHQALAQTSTFTCSDETLNKIWSAGIRSTLSNTFYSLTDCPTREKLGWTNDAQASLEQFLFNFEGEKLLEKWLIDICDTMNADGDLSGVAPSPDWGYGHGPVCNGIIFTLPYLLYKYCGNYSAVEYALPYMTRYYEYLKAHLGESSLGDWTGYRFYATPIDFIEKTYLYMFASIFVELEKDYALECEKWQNDLERYIENGRCVVDEQCAISALIVLGIGDEKTLGAQLVENVEKADRHMKTGMFGAQFLYKALEKIGRTDLAYCAITNPSEPSFRVWIEQGATTLWESFDTDAHTLSKNHHMFSNVLYFFVESICGAKRLSKNRYNVCAKFVPQLSFAECSRVSRDGAFSVKWERENGTVKVTLSASGEVVLEYKNVKIESGTRVFYIEEK